MAMLRPFVVLLLVLLLPFKAIAGGMGIACAAGQSQGAAPVGVVAHAPDHAAHADHAMAAAAHGDRQHTPSHVTDRAHASHDHDASDACRFCMECCAGAATAPHIAPAAAALSTPLRLATLASLVHPHGTRAGVFRPPRFLA